MDRRRILIVANQTAAGEHVKRLIRRRLAEGPCTFTLLVPASPPPGTATWTEGGARAIAQERMDAALPQLRALGADVSGMIGDTNPVLAIDDVMRHQEFDEIVISTLPHGASKWLRQDVPHKVRRRFAVTVTHVVDSPAPAHAG